MSESFTETPFEGSSESFAYGEKVFDARNGSPVLLLAKALALWLHSLGMNARVVMGL